jgi:hypothetical protein
MDRRSGVASILGIPHSVIAVAALSCSGSGRSYDFRVVNRDTIALDSVLIAGGGA